MGAGQRPHGVDDLTDDEFRCRGCRHVRVSFPASIESVDTIPPFLGAPAPPCYPDRALPSPAVAKGDGLGWLNRLLGARASDPSPSFDALQPGDEVWSGGQPWQVTAVRTYKRQEVGTASIERVLDDVDARPGDTLSYQVLRSPDDAEAWISVETWAGGFVEVSVGRPWPVDKLVAQRERRA